MEIKYYFTQHAIDRLRERFPYLKLEWNRKQELFYQLNSLINEASEEKAWQNNSNFMMHIGEKYGYGSVNRFFANSKEGILFVVSDANRVVTCYPIKFMFTPRKKDWKKKDKPSEKKARSFSRGRAPVKEAEAYREYIEMNGLEM